MNKSRSAVDNFSTPNTNGEINKNKSEILLFISNLISRAFFDAHIKQTLDNYLFSFSWINGTITDYKVRAIWCSSAILRIFRMA